MGQKYTKESKLIIDVKVCERCSGTGTNLSGELCKHCEGTTHIRTTVEKFIYICKKCKGSGRIKNDKCQICQICNGVGGHHLNSKQESNLGEGITGARLYKYKPHYGPAMVYK